MLNFDIGLGTSKPLLFTPRQLFKAAEVGAWYDPSDLSTLFQDSTGTTPVTADGDPVGLMLDKSQGLVLGPELVTNGTFDTDTDWTKAAGMTISGGVAQATTLSTVNALFQNMGVVNGKTYLIEADVTTSAGSLECHLGGLPANANRSDSGRLQWRLGGASGVNGNVIFNTSAWTGTIDNVSVKELPGNHATQTVSASRPVYKTDGTLHWLAPDGVDDYMKASLAWSATPHLAVGAVEITDAARDLYGSGGSGGAGVYDALLQPRTNVANKGRAHYWDQGNAKTVDFDVVEGARSVVSQVLKSGQIKGRNNLNTEAELTFGTALGTSKPDLFLFSRDGATAPYNKPFYGGVILLREPTQSEWDRTVRYLAKKSGVTL